MIKTLLKTSLAATAISAVGLLAPMLPSRAATIEPPVGAFYGLDFSGLPAVTNATPIDTVLKTGPYFGDFGGIQNQMGTFTLTWQGSSGGETGKPLGAATGEINLGANPTGGGANTFQKIRLVFTPSGPWAALPILRISNPMNTNFTFNNFAGQDDNWTATLDGGAAASQWVVNNPLSPTNPTSSTIGNVGAIINAPCVAGPGGPTAPPASCGPVIPSTNVANMTNLLANGSTWSYPYASNDSQARSLLLNWSLTSGWKTSSIDLMFANDNPTIPNSNTIKIATAIPEPLTMLGAGTAVGFGAFFKRRLAQAKSKKADQN